jgi:hypothetical protein
MRNHNEIVLVSVALHRRIARATQSHMRYCDPVTSKGRQALDYRPPEEFKQVAEQGAVSIRGTMSFFKHKEIFRSDVDFFHSGQTAKTASPAHVSMSLRLVIPWWVGLHLSPPPLHQPRLILAEKMLFEYENSTNGKCANSSLSQQRGSPQTTGPIFVPTLLQNRA